jgi:uncharacterized membrane protein
MRNHLIRQLLFSGIVLAAMVGLSAWAWQTLPAGAQMPVHWGIDGTPDRYGEKWEGLLLLPGITVGLVILLSALLWIDPLRTNLQNSAKPYFITWSALLLFLAGLHIVIVMAGLGQPVALPMILSAGTGLLFIVMGNYFGKIRRNYTFGIRTPWTVASDRVWDKTHRLGGKLFMASGLLSLVAAFIGSAQVQFTVLMGSLLMTIAVLTLYSYWQWRQGRIVEGRQVDR